MNKILRNALIACLIGTTVLAAGCDDEVRISHRRERRSPAPARIYVVEFANPHSHGQEVWITPAGMDRQYVGVVPAHGRRRHEVIVLQRNLPLRMEWQTAHTSGSIRISRNSVELGRIVIGRPPVRQRPPIIVKPHRPRRAPRVLRLTVVNRLNQRRGISIAVGGNKMRQIGKLAPGATKVFDVKIPRRDLPAQVAWKSSSIRGAFRVSRRSPDNVRIVIDRPVARPGVHKKQPHKNPKKLKQARPQRR